MPSEHYTNGSCASTPFELYTDGRGIMATLSELVEVIAEVEGLDPATVNLTAREVREAGLIKTGGRGTSAARMDFADAAALLIAVNATTIVREAAVTVRRYSRLEAWEGLDEYLQLRGKLTSPREYLQLGKLTSPRLPTTFGVALEELIKVTSQKALPINFLGFHTDPLFREAFSKADIVLELTFSKPSPKVNLTMYVRRDTGKRHLDSPIFNISKPSLELYFRPLRHSKSRASDRSDTTVIGFETIRAVAELLRPAD
jgi:hypothetical protein